jgi:hypothetical protein
MKRLWIPIAVLLLGCGVYLYFFLTHAQSGLPNGLNLTPKQLESVKQKLAVGAQARQRYPKLFGDVAALMFKEDPMGINDKTNTDEYDPEAGAVIARLKDCRSADDVTGVLWEEFTFSFDSQMAGSRKAWAKLGGEIWALWLREKDL